MLETLEGPILSFIYLVGYAIVRFLVRIQNATVFFEIWFFFAIGKRRADSLDFLSFDGCLRQKKSVGLIFLAMILLRLLVHFTERPPHVNLLSVDGLLLTVAPAFTEEPIFRAFFYQNLATALPERSKLLLLIMALVNVAVHAPFTITHAVVCFVFGWLISFAYHRTRCLSYCIVLHTVWNIMTFLVPSFRSGVAP